MTEKQFKEIIDKFELDQKEINTIARELCSTCTVALDEFIGIVSDTLRNNNISDVDLDYFILSLPIYIYHASTQLERLGLNEDISALKKKEAITATLTSGETIMGNAQTKVTIAELRNADAVVLNLVFARAYKMAKAKLDCAYEVLASCKKVMSRRIEELKAFNSDTKTAQNYFNGRTD